MRKKQLFGAAALCLCLSSVQAPVQAGVASDIGTDIAASVIHSMLGDKFGGIFAEGGQQGITPAQLADAIETGFNDAAKKAISVNVDTLQRDMRIYIPSQPYESAIGGLNASLGATSKIQSEISGHMSKANFMDLVPGYIITTNARLSVMTELARQNYNRQPGADYRAQARDAIAQEARNALHELSNFFIEDFNDPDMTLAHVAQTRACITKVASLPYWPHGGRYTYKNVAGSRLSMAGLSMPRLADPSDISTRWCPATQGTLISSGFGIDHATDNLAFGGIWQTPGVSPSTAPWTVLYKDAAGEYHYTTRPSFTAARFLRARGSSDSYPNTLGKISDVAKAWFDIVAALGTDDEKTEAAKHATVFVDIGYLRSKTPAAYDAWYDNTAVHLISGS